MKILQELLDLRFGDIGAVPETLAGNEAIRRLAGRGVVRRFKPEPLPAAVLDTLAAVALSSPSKSDAILARYGFHVVELPLQAHPDIPSGGIPAGPRSGPMSAIPKRLRTSGRDGGNVMNRPRLWTSARRSPRSCGEAAGRAGDATLGPTAGAPDGAEARS
jgi:hypothetical protein